MFCTVILTGAILPLHLNWNQMSQRSKIVVFFLIPFVPFFIQSCKKSKNDVIPTVYVNFSISLNDPLFLNLVAPFTYSYIDSSTNNYGQPSAGYDGNGIILFRSTEDEFYAYDRTCPYDYVVKNKSVKVNVVDDIFAVCPQCSTKYALTANGTPLVGVGRYPLKNYRAYFDGLHVFVSNY